MHNDDKVKMRYLYTGDTHISVIKNTGGGAEEASMPGFQSSTSESVFFSILCQLTEYQRDPHEVLILADVLDAAMPHINYK